MKIYSEIPFTIFSYLDVKYTSGKMTEELPTTLFIRHIASELTADDQVDLLKHFGAIGVRSMGHSGRMQHCAFARFENHDAASNALKRLHQLEILGRRLKVEFASKSHQEHEPTLLGDVQHSNKEHGKVLHEKEDETKIKERKETVKETTKNLSEKLNGINNKFGVEYSFNPKLVYHYPAPTANILTNIANAMACVPKFYTQVLHLMNKMNLPAPFGPLAPMPPIPDDVPVAKMLDHVQSEEMELSSSEESELESDTDSKRPDNSGTNLLFRKRPSNDFKKLIKKKLKLLPTTVVTSKKDSITKPEEVFEQPNIAVQKKLEIVVTGDSLREESTDLTVVDESGFGVLKQSFKAKEDSSDSENNSEEESGSIKFITSRELRKARLSQSELRKLSSFKNYEEGEPSSRLYVKNLAKQTNEKDLKYIFGRYVNWKDETETLVFDIRLMTEGRMKGQAFVTLANDARAAIALADTNGFVLHDKPMIVQYARSAKLKSDTVLSKDTK